MSRGAECDFCGLTWNDLTGQDGGAEDEFMGMDSEMAGEFFFVPVGDRQMACPACAIGRQ